MCSYGGMVSDQATSVHRLKKDITLKFLLLSCPMGNERLMMSDITSGLSPNFVFLFCLITPIRHLYADENSTPLLKQQWHELICLTSFGIALKLQCKKVAESTFF